ncbi:MAG: HEAT repeat domain-containing protein [Planctomycetota bacterium]
MIRFTVATLFVFSWLLGPVNADDQETLKELKSQLAKMADYQPGNDAEPLRKIESIVFRLPTDSAIRSDVEQALVTSLLSAKSNPSKSFLCEQLRVVGTAQAIPALAEQLTNPDVAFLARRALSRVNSPLVDQALYQSIERTEGKLKVGIINSLGDRRAEIATNKLIELTNDENDDVVIAAARALGRIGNAPAWDTLAQLAMQSPEGAIDPTIGNALLDCADQQLKIGDKNRAEAVYTLLMGKGAKQQFRVAGLQGLMKSCDGEANLLITAIDDQQLSLQAIALAAEVRKDDVVVTRKLCDMLNDADQASTIVLIQALATRGDRFAAEPIGKLAQSENETIAVAAIHALGTVGTEASAAQLLTIMPQATRMGQAAQSSLTMIQGDRINHLIRVAMGNPDDTTAVTAVNVYANRNGSNSVARLMATLKSSRPPIRQASLKALGQVVAIDDLDGLFQLANGDLANQDVKWLSQSIASAVARLSTEREADSNKVQDVLFQAIDSLPASKKQTLIPALGKLASEKALGKTQSLLKEPECRRVVAATLATWPGTSVLPDLKALALNPQTEADVRLVVLEGCARIAREAMDENGPVFFAMIQKLENANEQKMLIEAIGSGTAESTESLAMTLQFLEQPELNATAGLASLRICNRLRSNNESLAKEKLAEIITKVDNEDVQERALEVLNDIDKFQDHILIWETVGPYTDPSKRSGPEIFNVKFGPETDEQQVEWKPLEKGIGDWRIDLEKTYGDFDFVVCYCRTRVWAAEETQAVLEMGADDGVAAWLNQKMVFDQYVSGLSPRRIRVPVKLKKGWNELQLKIADHQGGWGFCCRIRKPDGSAQPGLKFETASKPTKRLLFETGETFFIEDMPAFIFWPQDDRRRSPQPWVMYAPTLAPYPDNNEKWMHQQFLDAGIAVVGVDSGESYGSPKGRESMTKLWQELTNNRGFAKRGCLLGRSRGGLWCSSWAIENPERVAGFAGIYPVFDLASYPGLDRAAPAYELSEGDLTSALAQWNPIASVEQMAKAKIPVFLIHGDQDKLVPLKQNSQAFFDAYRRAGAEKLIELEVAEGQWHNAWEGFFRCQKLIDFVIERANAGAKTK